MNAGVWRNDDIVYKKLRLSSWKDTRWTNIFYDIQYNFDIDLYDGWIIRVAKCLTHSQTYGLKIFTTL